MAGRKFLSLVAAGAVSLGVATVVSLAGAGSALACVVGPNGDGCIRSVFHVQRTDGSLAEWTGPGTGQVVGSVGGNGTAVVVVCQTTGATEDGLPYIVWDKLDDGYYVYDYYVDTPGDAYHPALTVCPGSPPAAPGPPRTGPPPGPPLQCPPAAPPPGSGPAPGSGPGPGLLIDHAQWVYVQYQDKPVRCGWSLHVTPTLQARANAFNPFVSGKSAHEGFDELYTDYKNVARGIKHNVDGLMKQYWCHAQFVAVRSPRKATWDLDEWRPDVSYLDTIRADCNP